MLRWLLRVTLITLLLAIGTIGYAWHDYTHPGPLEHESIILIPYGTSALKIAKTLAQHHVL